LLSVNSSCCCHHLVAFIMLALFDLENSLEMCVWYAHTIR
jgi:hypothetical protein